MHETPMQANKMLKRLSQMMDLAVTMDWVAANPVLGVSKYATTSEGYHSWDEGEIARFYEVHPIGSPAHICMTLMLYTGAAKVDAVKLGPANVKDGRIEYRRQKTSKNPSGVLISLPIHPALAAALAARPVTFTYLETGHNKTRSRKGLGTSMRKWCDKAGLPLCSSHGLRKAICRVSPRRVAHLTKSWRLVDTSRWRWLKSTMRRLGGGTWPIQHFRDLQARKRNKT